MLRRKRRYSVSEKKELGIGLMHPPALTAYSTQLLEVDNVEGKYEKITVRH